MATAGVVDPNAGMIAPSIYDWSKLPYYGLMQNLGMPGGFDSGSGIDPSAPTYAKVGLPGVSNYNDYSFQGLFGGHSGVTQNPDGTFTAQRRVQNNPSNSAYEQTQYKLSDDGKSLVPVNNQWNPVTIKDTGFLESIGDAVGDFAGVLGDALPTLSVPVLASLVAPSLGLTGSGSGAAAGAGAYLSPAEMDTLLASQTAAGGGVMGTGTAASGVLGNYMSPGEMDQILANQTVAGGGAAAGLPALSTVPTPTVPNPSATGTLGSAASGLFDIVKSNPSLFGALLGGLAGGGASGGGSYNVGNRTPLKPLERPLFAPRKEDYGTGLPSGLGNQSAGLFAEYMRKMGG